MSAEELALLDDEDIEAARLVFEEELKDRLSGAKYRAMYALAQMFKQAKPSRTLVCIDPEKLAEYLAQAATIEALQADVTTLRTALEEAAGLFNEMHLPLQGHAATRCTLRTDFCVTAEHVREALHGRE